MNRRRSVFDLVISGFDMACSFAERKNVGEKGSGKKGKFSRWSVFAQWDGNARGGFGGRGVVVGGDEERHGVCLVLEPSV